MQTLAELLTGGHPDAERRLDTLCAELGIRLVPDHEGALLHGAFVQRRNVAPSQYLELARSWEQFDRAFAPADKVERAYALTQLQRFVERTGIAGDLGDHILFVIEREGAADILVSLGDEHWDDWLATIPKERSDGDAAALRLREYLQRDPRPRARSREPGLKDR